MSDKPLPFVVTDRRKFRTDGEPRPDADPSPEKQREPEPAAPPPMPIAAVAPVPEPDSSALESPQEDLPPAPTAEQMEQSRIAYDATAERLDIAIRAANPGMERPPAMSFEQLVQSVYMQAVLQLGGGTQEGQQPQVDILGARQSIDMLTILLAKTEGSLSKTEDLLLSSAVFELRLAFLEITQALARSAQPKAGAPPAPGSPAAARPGPSLIR